VKYAFIQQHTNTGSVKRMCSALQINRSGDYAWRRQPDSARAVEDARLADKVKAAWRNSEKVYGYRKIHADLRDDGEQCGINRVHKLMKNMGIRSEVGYRKPRSPSGEPHQAVDNILDRQFHPEAPDQSWVTDFTYIRTHEGWLYLAIVLDLFSRKIVGWSMKSQMTSDLVLDALIMALWRRKPTHSVLVHSDQGSQYTSGDWAHLLEEHGLVASMSRRGNCHDNAVAESFFQLLKRERIKRQIYRTRADARADVFDYIEMFYNPKRRHGDNGLLSPVDYEDQYIKQIVSV